MMFDRIFVATGEKTRIAAWEMLAKLLVDRLKADATVTTCRDVEGLKALRSQRDHVDDLIIIDEKLPLDRDEQKPARAGFDYVASVQKSDNPPACILMAAGSDWILSEVAKFGRCRLLGFSSEIGNLLDPLEIYARQLSSPDHRRKNGRAAHTARGESWALLEFNVRGKWDSTVTLHIGDGVSTREPEQRPFELNVDKLREIIRESRRLRRKISSKLADARSWAEYMRIWQKEYSELGADVFSLINQDRFPVLWGRAVEAADSNVRIRFTVDKEAYDCLWESIYDEGEQDWLIAHGGVARRARLNSPYIHRQTALDGGDGIINVLAIFSNIAEGTELDGPDDEGWKTLKRSLFMRAQDRLGHRPKIEDIVAVLCSLRKEQTFLEDLMQDNPGRFRVTALGSSDCMSAPSLVERVRQELTADPAGGPRRYDIVHFAGHALFNDGKDGRGYLIFADAKGAEAVPIATFAQWLEDANIQMAYLNCCQSSASRAAFELANSGVPLAIGFAYDLDSEKAAMFAKTFYELIVEKRVSICRAVHEARAQLRNEHYLYDPTWTAPVLVAQPEKWEWVESCFSSAE